MVSITLVAALLGLCLTAFAFSGSGTKTDPFRIANAADLAALSSAEGSFEDVYFVQTADVTAQDFTPIGTNAAFGGHYDGGGYAISLYGTAALFEKTENATLLNIRLTESTLTATDGLCGLVGKAGGSTVIENCAAKVTVDLPETLRAACIGGIAGSADAQAVIRGCTSSITVSAATNAVDLHIGGIVGDLSGAVKQCTAEGTLAIGGEPYLLYLGGIVGHNSGTVEGCVNKALVSGSTSSRNAGLFVGGVVGHNESGRIERTQNEGAVTGNGVAGSPAYVGGIVGFHTDGTAALSKNAGAVGANSAFVGGIAGSVFSADADAVVENCLNTGSVGQLVGLGMRDNRRFLAVLQSGVTYRGTTATAEAPYGYRETDVYAAGDASVAETLKNAAVTAGLDDPAWQFQRIGVLPELAVIKDPALPELFVTGMNPVSGKCTFLVYQPEGSVNDTTHLVAAFYQENRLLGTKFVPLSDAADGYVQLTLPMYASCDEIRLLPFASLANWRPSSVMKKTSRTLEN